MTQRYYSLDGLPITDLPYFRDGYELELGERYYALSGTPITRRVNGHFYYKDGYELPAPVVKTMDDVSANVDTGKSTLLDTELILLEILRMLGLIVEELRSPVSL